MPIDAPTNWRRWNEKEKRKINAGYDQAYINTNRFSFRAFINEQQGYCDSKIKVVLNSSPDIAGRRTQDTQTFDTLGEGQEYALNWMQKHPAHRDTTDERDAIEALTDVHEALHDHGLVAQNDADKRGWTTTRGSTGFSLRPLTTVDDRFETASQTTHIDAIFIHLTVDGKESGLQYRRKEKVDSSGDIRRFHDPKQPERLNTAIQRAIEQSGFTVIEGPTKGGHQTHWDHSVSYSAVVDIPDDLILPEMSQRRQQT